LNEGSHPPARRLSREASSRANGDASLREGIRRALHVLEVPQRERG
jgi:hypothetical protein